MDANNEKLKKSKKDAKEKADFAEKCTKTEFKYRGVDIIVRKNNLVLEAV